MAEKNAFRTAGMVMIVGGLALAALTFITWYEINGNDVIKATYRARYNSVAALFASFVTVNEVSVMP